MALISVTPVSGQYVFTQSMTSEAKDLLVQMQVTLLLEHPSDGARFSALLMHIFYRLLEILLPEELSRLTPQSGRLSSPLRDEPEVVVAVAQ
jgi:hypothetical protein